MEKECVTCTVDYYSGKEMRNTANCSNMDALKVFILSKSVGQRDNEHMTSLIGGI